MSLQDLLKALNPVDLLKPIGAKIPPPLDTAFKKALEVAAFAPLLPIIDKLKSQDLEGAVAEVLSPSVLKVTKNLDAELPRKVLKKILGASAVLEVIKENLQSGPKELAKPMQMLEELAGNLDGDIDEIIARFGKAASAFQSTSVTVSGAKMGTDGQTGFRFPQDIIKKISPVAILSMVGEKLPSPLKSGFDKVNDDVCHCNVFVCPHVGHDIWHGRGLL